MTIALALHPKVKLTVDGFNMLAEGGELAGFERSELLDGDIYLMSPQYSRHGMAKAVLHEALLDWKRAHRPELVVLTEVSVAMPPHDEPMPDVILTRRPQGQRGVPVASVSLLIEVSNDTLKHDLGYKAALYARQGVPEYWVVDLGGQKVVRHAEPRADGYARIDEIGFGEVVGSLTLDGLEVETRKILE